MKRWAASDETADVVREMHHCIRNNFQIIASLINLQKRELPSDRRAEMRLVEEHVQSIAVVYRVAETPGTRVRLDQLVIEVVDILRHIAGLPREAVSVHVQQSADRFEQQRAIAFALLLANMLPPYLDLVRGAGAALPIVAVPTPDRFLTVSIAPGGEPLTLEPLRLRLVNAYLSQLSATLEPGGSGVYVRFPIDRQSPRRRLHGASQRAEQSGRP